jgi:hypothetical protein
MVNLVNLLVFYQGEQVSCDELFKKGFVRFRLMGLGQQPGPDSPHEVEQFAVLGAELVFEAFADMFGEGGAFPGSGNRHHKVTASNNRREDEIADFRPIGNVTQQVAMLRVGIDPPVQRFVIGCTDHQKHAVHIR